MNTVRFRLWALLTATAMVVTFASSAAAQTREQPESGGAKGVYTAEQAERGESVFKQVCAQCHTASQHKGATFESRWAGRTLHDLLDLLRSTMPQDNPSSLSSEQYLNVVAYILKLNGFPAGEVPLTEADGRLKQLRIPSKSP